MFTFHQRSGLFEGNGLSYVGYSGTGEGRNNPDYQSVPQVGPIPVGTYDIGAVRTSSRLGPLVLDLSPTDNTDTLGRSLFRIHGNNKANDASHGCIILPPWIRLAIDKTKGEERKVQVVRD